MDKRAAAMSVDLLTRLEARGKVVVVRAEPFHFAFADAGGEVELICYRREGDGLWTEFSQADAGWPEQGHKGGWCLSSTREVGYVWRVAHSRHPVVAVRFEGGVHEVATDDRCNWAFIRETPVDHQGEPLAILN